MNTKFWCYAGVIKVKGNEQDPKILRVLLQSDLIAPQHAANCYWRERGGCPICSEVFGTVCWHAKTCSDVKCTVPYCQTIRRCLVREIIRERAS